MELTLILLVTCYLVLPSPSIVTALPNGGMVLQRKMELESPGMKTEVIQTVRERRQSRGNSRHFDTGFV
ncbi:AAEL017205-PA [Aedes aegypti]|uniref:AAEL017205-PA n=1 Tax=Aedes aegypti TaxID=7159 RepID=J9HTN6_AEDAE|nr:AAEL017205-PA [Aedes aegypti]